MTGRPVVAAFDFDETLTTRDTVIPFLRRFSSPVAVAAGFARRPTRTGRAIVRRSRSLAREIATETVFAGRRHDEVVRHAHAHAERIIGHWLRTDTVDRLRWHVAQGHEVVIVSASYHDYLVPVGRHLGATEVLATRLDVSDGVCTGTLDGPNCRGPEKVRRLDDWLTAAGRHRDDVELWTYGDSPGDREMLAWADQAVWVHERLASVAPST